MFGILIKQNLFGLPEEKKIVYTLLLKWIALSKYVRTYIDMIYIIIIFTQSKENKTISQTFVWQDFFYFVNWVSVFVFVRVECSGEGWCTFHWKMILRNNKIKETLDLTQLVFTASNEIEAYTSDRPELWLTYWSICCRMLLRWPQIPFEDPGPRFVWINALLMSQNWGSISFNWENILIPHKNV